MLDNFQKILFLAVMVFLTIFANRNFVSKQTASITANGADAFSDNGATPVFILESPAKVFAENTFNAAPVLDKKEESENNVIKQAIKEGILQDLPIPISAIGEISNASDGGSGQKTSSGGFTADAGSSYDYSGSAENYSANATFYRVADGLPVSIGAQASLVADLKTKEVFFTSMPRKRWPLASITKLVSAAIVMKDIAQNQSTTLQLADFSADSAEKKLKIGDRYSIRDFLRTMLMISSNESAEALARFYGRDSFVSAMNAMAREWGLFDTHFDDPTGISSASQSTAEDLVKLAGEIYDRYPDILRITKTPSALIAELNSGRKIALANINNFAGRGDFIGGKTGYTEDANGNLLSIFSYKKEPILIIVLGTDDRFGDTEKLFGWFKQSYR